MRTGMLAKPLYAANGQVYITLVPPLVLCLPDEELMQMLLQLILAEHTVCWTCRREKRGWPTINNTSGR